MKKNLFMVAAVALMAFAACNKEEINDGAKPSYYVEFVAEAANEDAQPDSKTTYDQNNKKTLWENGDAISVNGKRFETNELSEGGLSARFVNTDELEESFGSPFLAAYPYSDELTFNGSTVSGLVIDATPALDSKGSNMAIAYQSEGNTLSFKNITSMIRFSVAMDGVTEVEISSNNGSPIAGTIEVDWNNGVPSIKNISNGSESITVTGNFVKGTKYYVNVIPTTIETGVTIRLNGIIAKSKKTSVTLGRSKMMVSEGLALDESGWDITGDFNDYGSTWSPGDGVKLYKEEDASWYVAKNVSMTNGFTGDYAQFKITKGNWDESYGADNFQVSKWWNSSNGNAYIPSGKYDIYFNESTKKILALPTGSKTLTVYLSWNNRPNLWYWSDNAQIASDLGFEWPGISGTNETIEGWGYKKWMAIIPYGKWGQNMKFIFCNDDSDKLEPSDFHKMSNVMFYNGENGEFLK